jgi:D-methionine transport system ATP-binding protein
MITLDRLTKDYGRGSTRTRVLDQVSFSVGRGEIAAVVGPSGAGKSTLAKCINLLERPTSGTVDVDGRDLTSLSGKELRTARHAIGTVFQSSALLRRRTAAANVALPLEFLGVTGRNTRRRVDELLELVGLADRRDAYVSELSGGQQQRIGIARALALNPSVLLADEATSGLDPATTASILGLIKNIRDELDLTVVLITHEMDVVRDAADTVHRLDSGRVAEAGRLTEVLLDPASVLSDQLLPARGSAAAQGVAWAVRYRAAGVQSDWLARVGSEFGVAVGLLGAHIEEVDGVLVGRAVVDLPSTLDDEAVSEAFRRLGLESAPTGPAYVTRTATRLAS